MVDEEGDGAGDQADEHSDGGDRFGVADAGEIGDDERDRAGAGGGLGGSHL
jgi:hypothetical protein